MGQLVNGKWEADGTDTRKSDGKFKRTEAAFRNWVTKDGSPGPTGVGGFKAEPGRYHLYVAYACPWAHRTLMVRKLKKLEDVIDVSVVHPFMGKMGWSFEHDGDAQGDPLFGSKYVHELYIRGKSDYTGRASVPVLWDKERGTVASNESSEIIRMFNSEFNEWGDPSGDL